MTNPAWTFALRGASSDTLEIDIYDDIGESFWGDTVSAKDVRDAIKRNPNAKTIRVRVNSRGGDVFDGFAIYNMLNEHPARIEAQVDALAASMASIVIMAADEITVAANAMIMIHNPWAFAMGEADELRSTADLLDKMRDKSADVYVARTGISKERALEMMDAETWLSADEAKSMGFADVIVPAKKSAAQSKMLASLRFDGLIAPPKSLIAACAQAREAAPKNAREGTEPEQELTTMEKAERIALCSALGVSADVSNDVLVQRASALVASAGKAPEGFELAVKGELAAAQARATAAETELQASRKLAREAAVKVCLDSAVKDGKIVPASREKYEARCASDEGFEIVKDIIADLPVSPLLGVQGKSGKPANAAIEGSGAVALTAEEERIGTALGRTKAQMLADKQAELSNGGAA